jgi:hypothetical protein
MEGWVKIYSSNQEHQIQILKQFLEQNDVAAFIVNKQDRNYLFGDIELHVKPDDVVTAKYLLKDYT